jgi:predicted transcriptional regulator
MRSELTKELLNLGMKQKQVSELLDISQPPISHYISDKRGHELKFEPEIHDMIRDFAQDLANGKAGQRDIISKMCEICKKIKSEEVICQLHKEKDKIPLNCTACMGSQSHF